MSFVYKKRGSGESETAAYMCYDIFLRFERQVHKGMPAPLSSYESSHGRLSERRFCRVFEKCFGLTGLGGGREFWRSVPLLSWQILREVREVGELRAAHWENNV